MRFSLIRFVFASFLALLFLGGSTAFGQGTSASLTGQVTDNSGAVVPGATVTATNTDTGLAQTATSNGEGIYLIVPLPPGHYKLMVEAKGFERYVQSGIELSVSVNSTQNVVLKTGSVQEYSDCVRERRTDQHQLRRNWALRLTKPLLLSCP